MIDHITPEQLRAAADGPHRGTQVGALLRRAATAIEYQVAEHDHRADPKVWCTRCQHEHIASVPATTYQCDSCGFGQWDLGSARLHEAQQDGHRAYPITHPTVPLDERPSVPTAAGVLHEVITRIDEARYANGSTASPWGNADVLGLLAHLRQPYTEGGAVAAPEVDRLRELIESAPHDEHCELGEPDPRAYDDLVTEQPHLPCTCWKARA
jgi:hypothetical protein